MSRFVGRFMGRNGLRARAAAAALSICAFLAPSAAGTALGQAGEPLNWVAMGDSYSANVMVPPWDAPADSDGCGRSLFNWEALLAKDLNASYPEWIHLTDVTCGNATIAEGILGAQPAGKLHGPPANGNDNGGWVSKLPQINMVNADTDIITVGIGGNDFGFGEIVNKCLAIGAEQTFPVQYCKTYYESEEGQAWLNERWQIVENGLRTMIADLQVRAPQAKIFLLGYPAIVSSVFGCTYGNFHQLGSIRLTNDAVPRHVAATAQPEDQGFGGRKPGDLCGHLHFE